MCSIHQRTLLVKTLGAKKAASAVEPRRLEASRLCIKQLSMSRQPVGGCDLNMDNLRHGSEVERFCALGFVDDL